jgi:hypothetical protein
MYTSLEGWEVQSTPAKSSFIQRSVVFPDYSGLSADLITLSMECVEQGVAYASMCISSHLNSIRNLEHPELLPISQWSEYFAVRRATNLLRRAKHSHPKDAKSGRHRPHFVTEGHLSRHRENSQAHSSNLNLTTCPCAGNWWDLVLGGPIY